jgi:hypothetical protein
MLQAPRDSLKPATGIINGVLIGVSMWMVLGGVIWMLVK